MTLRQYFLEHKAEERIITEGTEEVKVLILPLNNEPTKDRHNQYLVYDKDFPTTLYILVRKSSGLYVIPHSTLLANHNGLSTTAKENYLKIIEDLKKQNIKYELNEDHYAF